MWRFILISFAFLGWSFYVLSGGADYEPRLESIQARAKLDNVRPLARPDPVQVVELVQEAPVSDDAEAVTRALSLLENLEVTTNGKIEVTLASVAADEIVAPTLEANTEKSELLTQVPDIAADQIAVMTDTRRVTGTVVNLRDGPSTFYLAIGSVSKGDAVDVLENPGEGWLKVRVTDTQQVGWMADWLVTAAAN